MRLGKPLLTLRKASAMNNDAIECRVGCGACCIAPSISSPIPGMPNGKPAGVRCVQLAEDNRCKIFGQPERPAVCSNLRPTQEMCGKTDQEALDGLMALELATAPDAGLNLVLIDSLS